MGIESIESSASNFSSVATASAISSGPSFSSEIGSSFSLADTIPFSAPTEISLGGSYQPGFSLADTRPFMPSDIKSVPLSVPSGIAESLSDINIDPDLPNSEISQVSPDAFTDEELLEPPQYLEQINFINIPVEIDNNPVIEQLNHINEPESQLEINSPINEIEAEMVNIVDEILEAPKLEILDKKVEELIDFRLPSTAQKLREEVLSENTPENILTEEAFLIEPLINSQQAEEEELLKTLAPELTAEIVDQVVADPVIEKAAAELINLSETPVILVEETQDLMALPQPEISQAVVTYESLQKAGIEEVQAVELIKNALVLAGTESETAAKAIAQVKIQNSKVKTSTKISKHEKKVEIKEEVVDEDEKKKKPLKFVIDEKALATRNEVLKQAVEMAPTETGINENFVDSNKVVLPTEVQSPGVISGILPKYFLEILNLGDGAYRLAVAFIKKLGVLSKGELLKKGWEINRDLPPVTIAPGGKEVGKKDVDRVLTFKPDPTAV